VRLVQLYRTNINLYNMKLSKNWLFCNSKGARLLAVALALLSLSACQEDFGGYYNQPSYVSSSSDEVLKARSDCKTYLKLVNKTLFKKQVEGSGQYTFLVPTDDAFTAFFANNPYGYKSVDDIPEDVAARMVSSWMMYNSYPCDTLSNVLEGFNTWGTNVAFKHKSPSYDVLRQETLEGVNYQIYEYAFTPTSFYLSNNAPDYNNYRYLPIFTERFNNNNSISSDDWKKVVGSEFSRYGNYLEAGIIDAGSRATNPGDLFCQNGVIHLVNKVVMPLENLDAMIRTYGDGSAIDEPEKAKAGAWALLRSLLYHKLGNGEYCFFDLSENSTASHYFEKAYPDQDMTNFRLRRYKNSPFSLNTEEYYYMQNLHASSQDCFYTNYNGGMTFYVPEKKVFLDYINNRLFKYIDVTITENTTQAEFDAAFNKLSQNVVVALWASMQADGMIWPSQFESSAVNTVGSSEHINGYEDTLTYDKSVLSAGIASNGMWQITNFVPKTAAFEGVASRLLLDPAYSLDESLILSTSIFNNMLQSKLAGSEDVNLSVVLWGNENAKWWDNIHYSTLLSSYANGQVGNETSVQSTILQNSTAGYVERNAMDPLDFEVDPLDGAYGGWAYTNNYQGGVLRYRKSGKVINGQPEIQIQTSWLLRNDENERNMWNGKTALVNANVPAMLQATDPTDGCYTSVVKDNSNQYVNGNVYLTTEHSAPLSYTIEGSYGGQVYRNQTMSILNYVNAYLVADAKSANPRHTLFKKFFDFYETNKKLADTDTLNFNTGKWTIYVPTDEALQLALDYPEHYKDNITGKKAPSILWNPDYLLSLTNPKPDGINWVDSVIYFLSAHCTKSGCYPDDGLSALYETSLAWEGVSGTSMAAPSEMLVSTSCKVTDHDRLIGTTPVKAWDGLLSGAMMSGYVSKDGAGNKVKYVGRPYQSGAYDVVDVYNGDQYFEDKLDNTVVREQGQSNIMAPNCLIHSLNGFVIYKIASHPTK